MSTKEPLDLGIDPESSERNILVTSPEEYRALPEGQKKRAWSTIKVASLISERTVASLYKAVWEGRLSVTHIPRRPTDRHGIAFIKVPSIITQAHKRQRDIARIIRVFRNTLKGTCWLPLGYQSIIAGEVDSGLRDLEQKLFGHNNNKGEEGNNHETTITA